MLQHALRRHAAFSVMVVLLVAALCACDEGEGRHVPLSYLRLSGADDIPTLDPAVGYDTASWMFEDAIFDTLLDYDDASNLVGELAGTWSVSNDGLEYTFVLRPNAHFTNGRQVVAADVKYSIERVLDPATRSPGAEFYRGISGAEQCRATRCEVPGIRAEGLRAQFRLAAVDPLFLHKLAMQFGAVVPREEVERWGEDFSRHPVGSGPFRLVRWDSGERLVLARNDSYHRRGAPGLDGIDYAMGVSEDLAWFKYESGELDVTDIPAAEFPRVMRTPRYRNLIRSATTMTTMYLGMNCEWPPFDDVLVRRAVNHAVNKEKVLRLINRRGVVAAGFIPPDMPGHQPRLQGYPHDPEQAKTLLALAGHGAGFRTTLWIRADDDAMRIGQAVQQDLREVGIAVDLRPLSWGPFLDAVRTRGVVPFFFLGWQADFPDPSNFLETLLHSKNRDSNNHTFFSDPVVDALLDLAAKETNPSRRLRLLRKAERRAISEAPWVLLYHPSTHVLVSPRVRDYRLHPLRPPRFDRVWIGEATDPDAPAPPGS